MVKSRIAFFAFVIFAAFSLAMGVAFAADVPAAGTAAARARCEEFAAKGDDEKYLQAARELRDAGKKAAASPFETEFKVGAVGESLYVFGQYNDYPKEWGDVRSQSEADLASFSDAKFCFVVHAFSSPKKIDILLTDHGWLSRVFAFSASIINQDHRNTYGRLGAILSVPPGNILATKGSDMGTPFARVYSKAQESDLLDDFSYKYYIGTNRPVSPLELLRSTDFYNEMMVAGTTTNSGSVKIIGLFFKTKSGKRVVSKEMEEKMERLGQELGVPIVGIEASPEKEF